MRKGQHQSDKHCGADYEETEGYKQLMGGGGGGGGRDKEHIIKY